MIKTIYVITWRYSDNSGYGLVRAYCDEEKAREDLKLLEEHGETRRFSIEAVSLIP